MGETTPSVTVVLPVRNVEGTVAEQLAALAAQDFAGDWEVVVPDNGSSDGTLDVVRAWAGRLPDVRIVDASDRPGVSHARNVGAAAARGELLAVCDGDDVVEPGWLSAFVAASPDHDLMGGAFDERTLNPPPVRAWRAPRPDTGLTSSGGFRPYAVGANCAVWAGVVRDLGGWNERYVKGGNDVEFSWRAQVRGYRLGYVPGAVVRYRYRDDLRSWARQSYATGRASAHLYADFRSHGMPPKPLRRVLRTWAGIAVRTPHVLGPSERRGRWVGDAAAALGRARASAERRVLYL